MWSVDMYTCVLEGERELGGERERERETDYCKSSWETETDYCKPSQEHI